MLFMPTEGEGRHRQVLEVRDRHAGADGRGLHRACDLLRQPLVPHLELDAAERLDRVRCRDLAERQDAGVGGG
jgi:hypothetical protein